MPKYSAFNLAHITPAVEGIQQADAQQANQEENRRILSLLPKTMPKSQEEMSALYEQIAAINPIKALEIAKKYTPQQGEQFTLTPGAKRFDQTGKEIANVPSAPPAPPAGFTLNPGDTRFDASGKEIAALPAAEKPLSLGAPQVAIVNGKRTFVRAGADGKTYSMSNQEIPADQIQPEAPAPRAAEPLEAIFGPDGKPVLVPRKDAVGKTPATTRERTTEDERKSAGFHGQMKDAITVMDEVESKLTAKELYQIQTLSQEGLIGMMNRGELSEDAKRYLQAFEQFTEARLRPVSGAAINDSEFARDRRTYAKQFSETPKLNEQRRTSRRKALDSLKMRAGTVLQGQDTQPLRKPIPGIDGAEAESTDGGKTWKRVK